ncbi:MAG: hypothetical protein BMS9Abin31_1306 [Gammaproteobacteria bacterium]|nr:MAG: hypothetical protein BMS9Abin31_1306 [Gammaproteobacteria bacterium]
MSDIPDFTQEEITTINDTLQERFGHAVETHLVDTEIRLYKGDRELTQCPAIYWEENDCNFIIVKKAGNRFHNQFFYGVNKQYGTGIEEYDDIVNCVVTLLRVQADHDLEEKGALDQKK